MSSLTLVIEEDQLETHFADNNRFYMESGMTLGDLDHYASSFGPVISAINAASIDLMTREQVLEVLDKAISECKVLNMALDLENAA